MVSCSALVPSSGVSALLPSTEAAASAAAISLVQMQGPRARAAEERAPSVVRRLVRAVLAALGLLRFMNTPDQWEHLVS